MTREISNSSKIGKEASMALFKLFQDAVSRFDMADILVANVIHPK